MVDKLLKNTKKSYEEELKSFQHIFFAFEKWEKTPYFIALFEENKIEDKEIYIGCSGGPDSMFLTFLLVWYRHVVKGQDLSITKIIHINHNTSESDLLLEDMVVRSFGKIFDLKLCSLKKNSFTETVLRKKRWEFYTKCIQNNGFGQSVYLCLGHNLTDRIENSFLHFDRGTHLGGIVNMQLSQKKNILLPNEIKTYTCFRPLLSFSKEKITTWCHIFDIPYGNDTHNYDVTQKRIHYRNKIQLLSDKKKHQFYTEWSYVYKMLEKDFPKQSLLTKISFPLFWDIQGLYKTKIPVGERELVSLLSTIDLFKNMSRVRLQEMMKWFNKKEGSLYLNGWWFLSAHGELFLVKQQLQSRFWEKTHEVEIPITEGVHIYMIAGYERELDASDCYEAILTFPAVGDTFGSKTYMKRAAKQHIPFFWRRSLPILKKNNKITAVLPSLLRPWKQ